MIAQVFTLILLPHITLTVTQTLTGLQPPHHHTAIFPPVILPPFHPDTHMILLQGITPIPLHQLHMILLMVHMMPKQSFITTTAILELPLNQLVIQ
jgi:hypothetical protein